MEQLPVWRVTETKFPGRTHEAFPHADPKNLVWLVSYLHHQNLQINETMFIS
jgi:hypothetical protein